jgi:SAM-dependent methyltransferase
MTGFVCPGCSADSFSESINYLGVADEFRHKKIVTCQSCSLKSIYPMPTDLEVNNYYNDYWAKHEIPALDNLFEAQAKSRYQFIESYFAGSMKLRVLDVGAGFGFIKKQFLYDIEYNAVEIDPDAIDCLRNIVRANNVYPSIDAATGRYDVIVLAHIIEHFKTPLDFMCQIREKLTDQGIILIEVPNKDYIYKTRNEPHLIFFQPETLMDLICRSGLNVVKCQTCGMRISDLTKSNKKPLIPVKKIIKRILPDSIVQKIRARKNRNFINGVTKDYTSDYGDDRQWIRLVANRF